ncbi:type IV pilus assembly protein PilA [Carnobacterium iners]|uniref:Type IV pilus assembly protein PilA n=1 Tax=Carnobacterium iners TaxID=1073423 RepID=A0A1X7NC67_9LACT|nr:prepilin-type N-terminal cleavage/methylation domain-containing protein [Carnobacterium iners]SEK50814.1 type IV pilus assembly protein PilA [Carnobacterium iners]SMH34467.1 type IV pilus assembly protein PilA [Carnobacterium iners]
MRNKIKQLLKKEDGFTLIELLAVIAILALIVAISIPLIGNVVADSKTKTTDAQKELVIDAAQLYELENTVSANGEISVANLKSKGFLESDFDEVESGITKVNKNTTEGKITYTVE